MKESKLGVLLTGSTGFVGGALKKYIINRDIYDLKVVLRNPNVATYNTNNVSVVVAELNVDTDWTNALKNVDVIIHSAARTHVMPDSRTDPLVEYRAVNVGATLNLARQAATSGVKRFIFISSIKVNGEQTKLGLPFTAGDEPIPEDDYGVSKLEAEQGLQLIAQETGMEVVIIRPPLVYGENVKGNFANMIHLVSKGLPLPLGAIHNQRSLVALDNLVDLIITCIDHPAAANQVFLASDDDDISTTELLRGVAKAIGKPSRLIPVPAALLQLGATMLGKKAMAQRLLGSLQVDITKNRELLDWTPPITVEEGLKRCFVNEKD